MKQTDEQLGLTDDEQREARASFERTKVYLEECNAIVDELFRGEAVKPALDQQQRWKS